MKKAAATVLYLAGSAVWLYFAVTFISAMFREAKSGDEWTGNAMLCAVGFIMIAAWILRTVMMLLKSRSQSAAAQKKSPAPEQSGTGEKA